ncbi:MAG TPA: NAD(P)/FAD-dependent oxidoreductase [Clostridia bacterium]|nr:NAD(P)/FAD-dependent oxidoreductase [Clostridia bacterium]
MSNVIIIGNGPAGVSAALYTSRAGISTLIIAKDAGALEKAEKIENYFGFGEPISGKELSKRGIAQAKRLGVEFLDDEVVSLEYDGRLGVVTKNNRYAAEAVVLATGAPRVAPRIKGLKELEGAGVSYCAICDGFFYKEKDVAVLGCCEYALHEAQALMPLAKSVTLVTNAEKPMEGLPEGLTVITTKIKQLEGEGRLEALLFEDGSRLDVSGLFIAQGVAGSAELARKLGAETAVNRILVNENMETNIPGLFAAGDCTGGMLQIAKAVCQGAEAGAAAVKLIRSRKAAASV